MKRDLYASASYRRFDPEIYGLFAEGDEGEGGGSGAEDGQRAAETGAEGAGAAEGAEGASGAAEGAAAAAKTAETDWRAAITDAEAKKFAESSTDVNHLARRAADMRKQLSSAIIKPGKDATPEQVAAFQKAMGVPEAPDKYEFPELAEGEELTDAVKASREAWGKRFHELGVPNETAKALMDAVRQEAAQKLASDIAADKAFAKEQMDALEAEWGTDTAKNREYVNRATKELFGSDFEDVRKMETKDGRFVLDDARLMRVFAKIGREMGEGTLGSVMTEGERDAADTQLRDLRKQIQTAQGEGDNARANKLYQQEQALIAKLGGNNNIVGAQGRAA